jgi:hypothetical protein
VGPCASAPRTDTPPAPARFRWNDKLKKLLEGAAAAAGAEGLPGAGGRAAHDAANGVLFEVAPPPPVLNGHVSSQPPY